jgi:hypothetical protein
MRSALSATGHRPGLQKRLRALCAGLRAALRALRADRSPHPTKH